MSVDAWLSALQQRHRAAFTNSEFLKAVRALSARYVERRASLPDRSPLDSAGKRAAFAAFYAPLHFLTTREVLHALQPGGLKASGYCKTIIDLGCGTGVAGAAWGLETGARVSGVDANAWAVDDARWNLRQLGVEGDIRRADMVRTAEQLVAKNRALASTAIICGWSVNELAQPPRERLLQALMAAADRGASVLVLEPLARSAVPWWDEWTAAFAAGGGEAREWRFPAALPDVLREIDDAAGFRRDALTARSLVLRF